MLPDLCPKAIKLDKSNSLIPPSRGAAVFFLCRSDSFLSHSKQLGWALAISMDVVISIPRILLSENRTPVNLMSLAEVGMIYMGSVCISVNLKKVN